MRCRRRPRPASPLVAAALLAGCGDATPGPTHDLVFGSGRSGDGDVFRLDPSTRTVTPLATSPRPDFNPRFDAARDRLVFLRETPAGIAMIACGPGTEPTPLGALPADDEPVDWHPDGSAYVYARAVDGNRDLYVFDLVTKRTRRLTTDPATDDQPRWSPDGRQVAFRSRRGEPAATADHDVWVVAVDGGSPPRNVSNTPQHQEGHPAWSPTGDALLYDSNQSSDGLPDIWIHDLGDDTRRNLTDAPGIDLIADWSPDGAWIAFGSSRDGDWDLYRVRPDGTDLEQLTDDPAFDGDPKWLPRRVLDALRPAR